MVRLIDIEQQLTKLQLAVAEVRRVANGSHTLLQRSARARHGEQALSTEKAFFRFDALLSNDSVRQALRYLVSLSDDRVISIFRWPRRQGDFRGAFQPKRGAPLQLTNGPGRHAPRTRRACWF